MLAPISSTSTRPETDALPLPLSSEPARPKFPVIAENMARKGLRLTTVGAAVGCSGVHVSHVIRGHAVASAALRARLAAALDQAEDELFAEASA
jgi:hypothetical protein